MNERVYPRETDYHAASTVEIPDECLCEGKKFYMLGNQIVACVCARKVTRASWIARCVAQSRVSDAMREQFRLDRWRIGANPGCDGAYLTVNAWVNGENKTPWLFLQGDRGLGKTHLLAGAIGALAAQGFGAVYYAAYDLELALKSFSEMTETIQFINQIQRIPVLALDDLGTQYGTPYVETEFHAMLDKRYVENLPTIISTNEPIETFWARLRSRVMDTVLIEYLQMEGADARPVYGNWKQGEMEEL